MNNPMYEPTPTSPERPGLVTAITILTLINGILNIFYALTLTGAIVLGTIGLGLLCAPITILPGILGVFEIIYAAQLISLPARPVRPSQTIAILEICAIITGNVVSLIVGILALVFYNDPAVRAYFGRINR